MHLHSKQIRYAVIAILNKDVAFGEVKMMETSSMQLNELVENLSPAMTWSKNCGEHPE